MNHVLLDNVTHKDLRIITDRSASYGDNIGSTLAFPTEFMQAQREYPIFFRKDPETAKFQSTVMFGFEQGENLFLDDEGWHAHYIPLAVSREPFLVGFQEQEQDGELKKTPVIHLDMDSPRVSDSEGEPVFLAHGGNSPYLQKVCKMMDAMHAGLQASDVMFEAFLALDLIEPFTLDVELNDGANHRMIGYYTINQEKLNALAGESLSRLHRSGFLHAAFMVVASLSNVQILIEKKNARLA